MQRQQIGRMAGIILALVAAAGIASWAQGGDTPIVILDGSLTMESAVAWREFTGSGDIKAHPHATKSVTQVAVTVNGATKTIPFTNQLCTVDVTYAATRIRVTTGANGKGLTVSPFSAFQNGSTEKILAHKNQNAKISHVRVMKAGAQAFDSDASGGTKIVISYK